MVSGQRRSGCSRAVFALVLCAGLFTVPADRAPAEEQARRPKIGLVLGGGGAKGSAHVGVLKVLEQMNIPVDYVAGTSMGAVIGSMYASGMSPDEIDRILTGLDWDDLFTDKPPRSDIDFRRKREDFTILSAAEFGVKDGKLRTPSSIIAAQKIGLLFETLLMPVSDIEDFDDLPTPFRAVASDLETGEIVVLGSGRLADAARASMSVPGVFPPAEVKGRYLIDGGILRNLPVDIVRKMGADIVIAVDVATPLPPKEKLGSPMAILNQMVAIMINDNVQRQLHGLRKQDVLIWPDLGTITSGDFKRGKEAIERGVKAARKKETELRRYSVSEARYASYRRKHRRTQPTSVRVRSVNIEGLERVSEKAVQSKLGIEPGREIDIENLKGRVGLVYGMGDFERVDLHAERRGDAYDLTVRPREKSWGPNYFRWGLGLESSSEGDSNFNLLGDYTMRWLNRLGAEWKNQVQFGSHKRLFSEFYQPLEHSRTFSVIPYVHWQQRQVDLYQGNDIIGEYRLRTADGGFDFGIQPWTYGDIRLGYGVGTARAKLQKGTLGPPEDDVDRGFLRFQVIADQLDNVNFPHTGYLGVIQYFASRTGLGADDRYDKISVEFSQAVTYRTYTLIGTALFGSYIEDEIPFYEEFTLGGFLNLSGYQQDQLRGQQAGLGRLVFYWNASQSLIGNFYLGLSVEAGNVWQTGEDAAFNDLLLAGCAFLGYDTPLGPLYLGYGYSEGGNDATYLYLGRVF